MRTFLGFTGYYRKFVPGYARKVKPLNDLVHCCYRTSLQGIEVKENSMKRNGNGLLSARPLLKKLSGSYHLH